MNFFTNWALFCTNDLEPQFTHSPASCTSPRLPDRFSVLCLNPDTLEPSLFPSSSHPSDGAHWVKVHRVGLTFHQCSLAPSPSRDMPGCWEVRVRHTHPPRLLCTLQPQHTHTHTSKAAWTIIQSWCSHIPTLRHRIIGLRELEK